MTEETIRKIKVGDVFSLYNPFDATVYETLHVEGVEGALSPEDLSDPNWHPAICARGENDKFCGWVPHWWLLYMCVKVNQ